MELFYTLMRVLFPDYCTSCKQYGYILCTTCAEELPGTQEQQSGYSAALPYKNPVVHSIIIALKKRPLPYVANMLAKRMYDASWEELSELAVTKNFIKPIVIPIPASPEKLSTVGFNHAEVLAKEFCTYITELSPVLRTDILQKSNTNKKQAHTESRYERYNNMQKAFSVQNNNDIHNSCIILVDDVVTTGATLSTAKQALIDSGARQVFCIAAAH